LYPRRAGANDADEAGHELVLAKTPLLAAEIARTVWKEAGTSRRRVNVVQLIQSEGDVG